MHLNVTVCHFKQTVGICQLIATHFFPTKIDHSVFVILPISCLPPVSSSTSHVPMVHKACLALSIALYES